jgi:hypothetical protein
MNDKQQKLVDETVNNYHGVDDIKTDAKTLIDEMFPSMAKSVNKNYDLFKKDPKLFMAKFIKKYMDDNGDLIERSVILGNGLGKAINEAS